MDQDNDEGWMDRSQNPDDHLDVLPYPRPNDPAELAVVAFSLGGQTFGLPIETVVQVVPMLKLVELPRSKDILEGVFNFHGQIVPVLNARRILAWPTLPLQRNTPILIIRSNQRLMGLIVDEMKDVIRLPAEKITGPDQVMPEGLKSVAILKGVAFLDDGSILLIDADHLLNPMQVHALNRIIEAMIDSQDGHRRTRQRRKNFNTALADQFVRLASELSPMDGQPPPDDRSTPPVQDA